MGTAPFQGVILAAGEGSRMDPLGDHLPKALVPICNRPLLAYQLDHLCALGIKDVILVVGFMAESIQEVFGDGSDYGVRIRYVQQAERFGLAHAVGQLEAQVKSPFVLMLGDIYFDVPDLSEMLRIFHDTSASAVLAVKEESNPEAVKRNFSVTANPDGLVSEVVEKPQSVTSLLKGCGLYVFDHRIFDAVRRTPRSSLRNEFELTDAIQCLIEDNAPVHVANIVENDINLTYVSDIVDCNVYELNKRGLSSLQGDAVVLAEGCTLNRSVLGDEVQIPHPINLEECVVLNGSMIHATTTLRRAVITPHAILT